MMKKITIAILSLCAVASALSPLGLQYPFGMPDPAVTGSAAALGGSGTAVAEEYFGTGLNPANIAIGRRSAYSALVAYDALTIKDSSGESEVSGYAPNLLSLILPLGAAGNIGFTMQKRYDANVNYYTTIGPVQPPGSLSKETKTIELQSSGGMTSWQAGYGYRFKNGLSLGLAYERLFFNNDYRDLFGAEFDYGDNRVFRTMAQQTSEMSFSSDGIRFGAQVPVHAKVTVGFAAEYVFWSDNGTVKSEYTRSDAAAAPIAAPASEKFRVQLPPSMNIGLAYRPDERWLVAVDAQTTLWERYRNDLYEPDGLRRAYGVSAGGRFVPAAAHILSAKYWEKILYGAGFRYNQLPIEESREYAVSIGTGLPIPNDGGVVDLVFEFGWRSDDRYRDSDYGESTVRFLLGINGGRNWFQTPSR